jgi:hypothetical protein
VGFDAYMKKRAEPDERKTFAGNDASAELICMLSESMLCFEQVRMEIADQLDEIQHRGEEIPPRLYLVMSELLSLEPVLVQASRKAIDLHGGLWSMRGSPLTRESDPG